MAKRVGTAEFEAEVLKEKLPVIVEFYSDSCIPCKQLSPILGGIEDDYEDQSRLSRSMNFDADLAGNIGDGIPNDSLLQGWQGS